MKDNLEFNIYLMLEIKYQKKFGKSFPVDWYSSTDYKLKIEIITEALDNNIKIEETNKYRNKYIERVITKKKEV